ncbi:TIGR03643 family protein [Acinetobacter sp. PK01]|nr:TIGR03643 family protein [Acinetobacter sp. PK01]UOG18273.1 TIGR03643 family protein [Acinetobacter sp. PK01]
MNITNTFIEQELSRIIEMAWEDRTPFEAIQREYGLDESAVIRLMRQNLKSGSFKLWRKRMAGRKSKHQQLRSPDISRAYCSRQYKHA